MAPKRATKKQNVVKDNNYNNLSLSDVLCPICRTILIEPVTLPCNHGFCSSCFDGTMANANLVCPLCRIRIGSWLRASRKENKLVNLNLWEAIQKYFPLQVKNKLEGVDEILEEDVPIRVTAKPGEIRKEYEVQKAKEEEQYRKQREEEAKASELYIQKLKEEEELQKSLLKEKLRLDEQVAKKLAEELSFEDEPSTSKSNLKNKNSKKQGPLDTFLKNMANRQLSISLKPLPGDKNDYENKEFTTKILCQSSRHPLTKQRTQQDTIAYRLSKVISERQSHDSGDTITSECRYFKPIDRKVPQSKNVHTVRVPAVPAFPTTVKAEPPNGHKAFRHSFLQSPFVVVRVFIDHSEIPSSENSNECTEEKSESKSSRKRRRTSDLEESRDLEDTQTTPKKSRIEPNARQTRSMTKILQESPDKSPPRVHKKPEKRKSLLKETKNSPRKVSPNKNGIVSSEKLRSKDGEKSKVASDKKGSSTERLKDSFDRNIGSPFLGFEKDSNCLSLRSRNGIKNLSTVFNNFKEEKTPNHLKQEDQKSEEVTSCKPRMEDNTKSKSVDSHRNGDNDILSSSDEKEEYGNEKDELSLRKIELIVGAKCLRSETYRKKQQEEEDLKLARKLHEELNNVRYSAKGSISQFEKKFPAPRRQISLYNFLEK